VVEVESLAALRAQAETVRRRFPAEDTPLRVPAEVERLAGEKDPFGVRVGPIEICGFPGLKCETWGTRKTRSELPFGGRMRRNL
jgi:hypothetical protein